MLPCRAWTLSKTHPTCTTISLCVFIFIYLFIIYRIYIGRTVLVGLVPTILRIHLKLTTWLPWFTMRSVAITLQLNKEWLLLIQNISSFLIGSNPPGRCCMGRCIDHRSTSFPGRRPSCLLRGFHKIWEIRYGLIKKMLNSFWPQEVPVPRVVYLARENT